MYETAQLYAAGALKVACIGLQCVGFNNSLYRTICAQSGKWASSAEVSAGSGGMGLGSGSVWNSTVANGAAGNGGTGQTRVKRVEGNENAPIG